MQGGSHVSAAEIKKMSNETINIGLSRYYAGILSMQGGKLPAMQTRIQNFLMGA